MSTNEASDLHTTQAEEQITIPDIKGRHFVFDVDGVLTKDREPISNDLKLLLFELYKTLAAKYKKNIYIVTGNSYTVTRDLLNGVNFINIFSNNADDLRAFDGSLIWRDEGQQLPAGIDEELYRLLQMYNGKKYGRHIEHRTPRFINFSLVGRNCPARVRKEYDNKELKEIAIYLSEKYPTVEAVAGGSISLDIYTQGCDKSRALEVIREPIVFFGDKTEEGGNDYPLAQKCDRVLKVESPNDTIALLEKCLEQL